MKLIFSKKRIFHLSSLFAVVFLFIFIVVFNKGSTKSQKIQFSDFAQVELKPDGFSPDSLIVQQGTIVEFINSKGGPSWPASDPHPIHTNYSAFDPEQPINSGDSWSYTFDKVGVWGFHDHLSPYFTGKITVVENISQNSMQSSECQINPDAKVCFRESLFATLDTKGLDKALDQVSNLYRSKPVFAGYCHDIMHDIGHQAYKNYLQNKNSVISSKAFYCANGFYHGFMASFLSANPDLARAHDFCALVGEKLGDSAPDAQLQCYHGIGHGLVDAGFQNSQVFNNEQNMAKGALANCEKVSDSPEQLYRCASGVFNGIANFYISGEHNLKVDSNDPFLICEKEPDEYKESCYGNFNSVIFWLAKNDFSFASVYVVDMKDKKYQAMAMRYLAGLATLSFAKINPEKAITVCRHLGDLKTSCLEGFAHGFLEHGEPGFEYQEAINFCTNETLERGESDKCLEYTLSGLRGWYSKDKTAEICNSINPEYKKYCQKL